MVMDLALWEGSPRVPTGGKISVLPLPWCWGLGVLILAGDLMEMASAPVPHWACSQPEGDSGEGKGKWLAPYLLERKALLKSVPKAEKGSHCSARGPSHRQVAADKSKDPHNRDGSRARGEGSAQPLYWRTPLLVSHPVPPWSENGYFTWHPWAVAPFISVRCLRINGCCCVHCTVAVQIPRTYFGV